MIFNLLSNPFLLVPVLAAILIAFTFHEFSHAFVAELLGDHTAKSLGRLTLNPLAHIHGIGFLMLLVAGFGWGKPVPYNPNNLKDPKWGSVMIGLAGPVSNLLLAICAVIILSVLSHLGVFASVTDMNNNLLVIFLVLLIQFNVVLMVFNLLPIPPLDGSKLLFALIPSRYEHIKQMIMINGPMILISLLIIDSLSPVSIFGGLFNFFLSRIDYLVF